MRRDKCGCECGKASRKCDKDDTTTVASATGKNKCDYNAKELN